MHIPRLTTKQGAQTLHSTCTTGGLRGVPVESDMVPSLQERKENLEAAGLG